MGVVGLGAVCASALNDVQTAAGNNARRMASETFTGGILDGELVMESSWTAVSASLVSLLCQDCETCAGGELLQIVRWRCAEGAGYRDCLGRGGLVAVGQRL